MPFQASSAPRSMKRFAPPVLALALVLLAQCHHADPDPVKPEDQLPPATQTGAHTFGCLLNGQPWMPTYMIGSNNYTITYDPTYAGGHLNIAVTHYTSDNSSYQTLSISGAPVTGLGSYPIDGTLLGIYYKSGIPGTCYEYRGSNVKSKGKLTITHLDQTAGIVSGTFDFKIWQPGCDTVRFTQGRFDYNL